MNQFTISFSYARYRTSLYIIISLPELTKVLHGTGNLDKTGNVGTLDQRRLVGALLGRVSLGSVNTVVETGDHDVLELLVNLLRGPLSSLRVLSHLQTRHSNTTTVGSLTRSVPDTLGVLETLALEHLNGLHGATHVGSLSNVLAASSNKSLGLLSRNLVLSSRRNGNINLANVSPRAGTLNVLELGRVLVSKDGQLLSLKLDLGNLLDLGGGESLVTSGNERSLGVGKGDNGTAKLNDLEGSVLGNVTRSGDGDSLALEGLLALGGVLNHLLNVVDSSVTGGLRSDQRSTPGETLSGQDTLEGVAKLSVLSKQVTDLSSSDVNVTGRDISVGSDVSLELSHERNAESADLAVRLALGVEVRTSLSTSHVEAGEGVLEDLLITKELENREVDGGVESESSLVRTESRVELDSVSSVDLKVSLVILPHDAELDHSLRDADDGDETLQVGVLLKQGRVLKSVKELVVGLLEFGLVGLNHYAKSIINIR